MHNIHITRFIVNMIEENTYLVYDDGGHAVLIDCGAYSPREQAAIDNYIISHGLKLERLFQTHAHFDHLFGAEHIEQTYGLVPEISEDEISTYDRASELLCSVMHRDLPLYLPAHPKTFKAADVLEVGSMRFEVIATPGHTPGGVCFYLREHGHLFSGDSLFQGEIGRCDLPGGDESLLINTLRERVLTLPEKVTVYPGHGESTTIGRERRENYYLKY